MNFLNAKSFGFRLHTSYTIFEGEAGCGNIRKVAMPSSQNIETEGLVFVRKTTECLTAKHLLSVTLKLKRTLLKKVNSNLLCGENL